MSSESDPSAITESLEAAVDAFNEAGHGLPTHEAGIDRDAEWKTQLTKACRLLTAVDRIEGQGCYTATIELCFGAMERSVEAYALAEGGDELDEFRDHTSCYDRAAALGLLSRTTTTGLQRLYEDNRTDSYYGGRQPTESQAAAMRTLSRSIHEFVTVQIREGGVCTCPAPD